MPCPLTIRPPVGTVHSSDTVLLGIVAIEYVNSRFGHNEVLITSILPGVAGNNLVTLNVLAALVPQPFVAVTDIEPPAYPAGYLKLIEFVP